MTGTFAPWRIAAIQMCSTDDIDRNLSEIDVQLAVAKSSGAICAVLPECSLFLGTHDKAKLAIAESFASDSKRGPMLQGVIALARKHQMDILTGGNPEASSDGKVWNTSTLVRADGTVGASYRKIHLFDIDIPGRVTLKESDATAAGSEPLAVDIGGTRVGITICYDIRFPELYRTLTLRDKCEVIVVTAAFTAPTGQAHWHTLLRSRAIENQVYIVAAAQWGRHNPKRVSYGHSVIYGPWGELIEERAAGDGPISAMIDPEHLRKTRENMPCLQHTRLR